MNAQVRLRGWLLCALPVGFALSMLVSQFTYAIDPWLHSPNAPPSTIYNPGLANPTTPPQVPDQGKPNSLITIPGFPQVAIHFFDTVQTQSGTLRDQWIEAIADAMHTTFTLLGIIEICWAAAIWVFEKDNLSSLSVEIIKKIITIGFFFTLLQNAKDWIPTIVSTFNAVGVIAIKNTENIPGVTITPAETITTDSILATGVSIIEFIWQNLPGFDLTTIFSFLEIVFLALLATIGIAVAYIILAAQFFVLNVEADLLAAAGAIFLGLGSSSWTREYVTKYLDHGVAVGVRLLVLALVMGWTIAIVSGIAANYPNQPATILTDQAYQAYAAESILKILFGSILQAILAVKAPELAAALLSGGIGLSANSAASATSSIAGAVGRAVSIAMKPVQLAAAAAKAMSGHESAHAGIGNLHKAVSAGRTAERQGTIGSHAHGANGETGRAIPGLLPRGAHGSASTGGSTRRREPTTTPGSNARPHGVGSGGLLSAANTPGAGSVGASTSDPSAFDTSSIATGPPGETAPSSQSPDGAMTGVGGSSDSIGTTAPPAAIAVSGDLPGTAVPSPTTSSAGNVPEHGVTHLPPTNRSPGSRPAIQVTPPPRALTARNNPRPPPRDLSRQHSLQKASAAASTRTAQGRHGPPTSVPNSSKPDK
jgi:type IV secretion system protein TrbL